MTERHLKTALRIIEDIQYITIATVCPDGSPWNTPVAPTHDENLVFCWGSDESSIHSQNIRNEKRVFIVIYDSTLPEGTGEGVYMRGEAEELSEYEGNLRMYRFNPQQIWINDEEQNTDGSFKRDIRIELNIEDLKSKLKQ